MGRQSKVLAANRGIFVAMIERLHETPGKEATLVECDLQDTDDITWHRWKVGKSLPATSIAGRLALFALRQNLTDEDRYLFGELLISLDTRILRELELRMKAAEERLIAIRSTIEWGTRRFGVSSTHHQTLADLRAWERGIVDWLDQMKDGATRTLLSEIASVVADLYREYKFPE